MCARPEFLPVMGPDVASQFSTVLQTGKEYLAPLVQQHSLDWAQNWLGKYQNQLLYHVTNKRYLQWKVSGQCVRKTKTEILKRFHSKVYRLTTDW